MKRSYILFVVVCIYAGMQFSACQSSSSPESTQEAGPSVETTAELPKSGPAFQNIDVNTFRKKMQEENTVILDVRTPPETQMGVIKGAIVIDINQPGFEEKIKQLDKNKTYLVYCQSGGRSSTACSIMAEAGFGSLFNLEEGYMAWPKE